MHATSSALCCSTSSPMLVQSKPLAKERQPHSSAPRAGLTGEPGPAQEALTALDTLRHRRLAPLGERGAREGQLFAQVHYKHEDKLNLSPGLQHQKCLAVFLSQLSSFLPALAHVALVIAMCWRLGDDISRKVKPHMPSAHELVPPPHIQAWDTV